ncbi:MAG TPA: hypothetical protein PLQ97_14175 [Myxococcota bacterium]|nr:hypothetical protein [Myxococcota bacterium]HQK52415.1 hypothetical protein [Myxococcota bacterium]
MNRVAWLVFGMSCLVGGSALAQEVRIISIDGKFLDGPPGSVEVWPGQVVSLVADEVFRDREGALDYAYRPVEDFLWLARDGSSAACDPRTDCRRDTNFEVTDYGVNYYVPRSGPRNIRIEVRAREGGGSDSVVLQRVDRAGAYEDRLTGLGWWTWIGDERVFIPYAYVDDWDPYTRGYWYWTTFGWTWYSYDPWGPVTDHYGHWRHHRVYGWVWIPDPLWVWRPAVVTFFFVGDFLGWWPYDSGWHHGYRRGYANGYDDGYWAGYWAGRRDGRREGRRYHGAVMVRQDEFYTPGRHPSPPARGGRGAPASREPVDLSKRLIRDPGQVGQMMESAVQRGAVGPVPGGGKDPAAGRAFLARRTGIEPQEVPLKRVSVGEGREVRQGFEPVRPVFEAPAEYRDLSRTIRQKVGGEGEGRTGIRASLADSVVRTAARPERSRPDRGVAMPPTQVGEGRQVLRRWAPRDLDGGGAVRVDPRREAAPPEVRPGPERPERRVPMGDRGVETPSPRPVPRPRPTWTDSEVQERQVPERVGRPADPEVSPWRPTPSPEVRREVPERSVPRPSEIRREVPERAAPRPSEMRREVPERSVPRPSEMRREVPERPAPRPSEMRREVPDRTETPTRSIGPSFRPSPAPSSGSQSAPPPTYVPPRPRDSGRGLPGRSGPFRR